MLLKAQTTNRSRQRLSVAQPEGATRMTVVSRSSAAAHQQMVRNLPDLNLIKGILFDIDGTLTNSDPLHLKAFQDCLVAAGFNNGVPIDEEFFRKKISGRHNPEIARDLFPDWTEEKHREFYEGKEEYFRSIAASCLAPMPGLLELLDWAAARGLCTAAVTNAPRANAELMLGALGLSSRFDYVVLGEECTRPKPFPDPYLHALQLLGICAHEAVVMEDSPSGIASGVAAGVAVVALTSGQSREVLEQTGAVLIVDDFHQVLALTQTPSGSR